MLIEVYLPFFHMRFLRFEMRQTQFLSFTFWVIFIYILFFLQTALRLQIYHWSLHVLVMTTSFLTFLSFPSWLWHLDCIVLVWIDCLIHLGLCNFEGSPWLMPKITCLFCIFLWALCKYANIWGIYHIYTQAHVTLPTLSVFSQHDVHLCIYTVHFEVSSVARSHFRVIFAVLMK